MATKTLGLKKESSSSCKHKIEKFEHDFMDFWGSLGFRLEKDKNSLSYKSSVSALRKILQGKYPWAVGVTLNKLRQCCDTFKDHANLNGYFKSEDTEGFQDLKKLYFHQFVQTYSGYSYLRGVLEGKFKTLNPGKDLEELAKFISEEIAKNIRRKTFSSGEAARILKFAEAITTFYADNSQRIAVGIDEFTIVKGSFSVINDFLKTKGADKNLLVYTGNYAAGAALTQAMDQFSYWKIYEKQEDINTCANKDPEKVKQVMAEKKKKEEDSLPDVVKRRREEMKNNGIEIKQKEEEDCSRRDEFLRKKNERRNPFSSRKK